MMNFLQLLQDRRLGITLSQRTSWLQGRKVPTQVLQHYWDEGLPFMKKAPTTAMNLKNFLARLDVLVEEHEQPHVRQLAEFVRNDVSKSVYGFNSEGKLDPRRFCKVKIKPPRYE